MESDRPHKLESNQNDTRPLLGAERTLEILFPDQATRPGLRTWMDWKAKGYVPFVKIGRRVFYDAQECRAALDRRFTVGAKK